MLDPLVPQVVIERRALNRAQEVEAVRTLVARRKADAVAIGRRLMAWKKEFSKDVYRAMLSEVGLILPSAEGFIMQARVADGWRPGPRKTRSRDTVGAADVLELLNRGGFSEAAHFLEEAFNEAKAEKAVS